MVEKLENTDDEIIEYGAEPSQPAPPRPGETDQQIGQRHKEALRNRDASPPPGFDPELSREMLHRLKSGDFTPPEQDRS
jgi:hypothetical protein